MKFLLITLMMIACVKKINVNTLITTGENDVGSTPEMSRNLSKMIQGSKFVEIKRANIFVV